MPFNKDIIYLASKSPRRQELLHQIGIQFEILAVPSQDLSNTDMVDETVQVNETAKNYVNRLSKDKVEYAWRFLQRQNLEKHPILSADTTVVINDFILGKPQSREEAGTMLQLLSGKTHQVLTSVAIQNENSLYQTLQISDVTFSSLSPLHVEAYINSPEPYDKAGGYGIQGLAGKFIKHIQGSYSGIMGLPLYETTELLRKAGVFIP